MGLTHKIDKMIRQQGYLKQIMSQYGEPKFVIDYLELLALKLPEIHHLNIPGVEINIITYKFGEYESLSLTSNVIGGISCGSTGDKLVRLKLHLNCN